MPVLGYARAVRSGVPNSDALVVLDTEARLRKQTGTDYDPTALYPAAGEYITFPNLAGTGIASLWGFQVSGELGGTDTDAGVIDCQLSEDDGTTWRYWGGAAWDAAGAGDWSIPSVVRTNIGTFPLGQGAIRGVRLRVRLRPDTTQRATPTIEDVWFQAEFNHDAAVDVMRTVRQALAALRYRLYTQEDAEGDADIVLFTHDFTIDDALGIEVYNITDDPGRGTDLFQAYVAGTGTVTLTAAQDVGDDLEFRYQGSAPVTLVPDAWFYASRVPAIEVSIVADVDEDQSGNVHVEWNENTDDARTRMGPRYLAITLTVRCIDKDQERASAMSKEVRRFLHENQVTSLATAQVWPVADVSGYSPAPALGDGVFAPVLTARMWVREDYETYTAAGIATTINARITGELEAERDRRVWRSETIQTVGT